MRATTARPQRGRSPTARSGRGGWSGAASGPAPPSTAANMAARRPRTAPGQSAPGDSAPRGEGTEARQPALRWGPRAAFTPLCREPVGNRWCPGPHTFSPSAGYRRPCGRGEGRPESVISGEFLDARAVGSARSCPVRCGNGSGVLSILVTWCVRVPVLKCVGLNC